MYEAITIILIILIIGIILDGARRMRNARRDGLKISRNAKKADNNLAGGSPDSEFPSGGARVATYRNDEVTQNYTKSVRQKYSSTRLTAGSSNRTTNQSSHDIEEPVPMLMECIEEQAKVDNDKKREEQAVTDTNLGAIEKEGSHRSSIPNDGSEIKDPFIGSFDDVDSMDDIDVGDIGDVEESTEIYETEDFDGPVMYQPPGDNDASDYDAGDYETMDDRMSSSTQSNTISKPEVSDKEEAEESERRQPDEVIVFNLMAKSGYVFDGEMLLAVLVEEGMKLGEMDIFHRHLDDDGDAPVLFSLANMVVPGTFNLSKMAEFVTPGVSMFLSLPIAADSIAAYENFVVTASNLAAKLDGDLKDENRSVLTKQAIEHARQRVMEYERKRQLAKS